MSSNDGRKHLFIIFAENGKLKAHCEELLNATDQKLLEQSELVFLNGEAVHRPIDELTHDLEESGVLMVYDGHNTTTHNRDITLAIVKKISEVYHHVYVCYHKPTADRWREEFNKLELKIDQKQLIKSHTDEPYRSLHKIYSGEFSLEHLIKFWQEESLVVIHSNRIKLEPHLDRAFARKDLDLLEKDRVKLLVVASEFDPDEYLRYHELISKIQAGLSKKSWEGLLKEFMESIKLI